VSVYVESVSVDCLRINVSKETQLGREYLREENDDVLDPSLLQRTLQLLRQIQQCVHVSNCV
jgi:hypothetical protein